MIEHCNVNNIKSNFIQLSKLAFMLLLQMDDNLRKSPQHPPRKLTTVKLSTAEEGNNSLNRLSPL